MNPAYIRSCHREQKFTFNLALECGIKDIKESCNDILNEDFLYINFNNYLAKQQPRLVERVDNCTKYSYC